MSRPPLPPFTLRSAIEKVRLAEEGRNTYDPSKVALAYSVDGHWRNCGEFVVGRAAIGAMHRRLPPGWTASSLLHTSFDLLPTILQELRIALARIVEAVG
ncbi:DUF1348 family protein (plasmid) [Rhizobium leguminosarum]|nr:DUF1348 family protein [Rhizobium leguminosarum bv. trifolii]TAU16447.1 DUF1348 family protein [Rhizobium leguminosarum]QIO83297.1 DUF1348 family protein [Rhizobium leguminosarum bv. trifolii]TAU34858.1 DUF1348 family protein [Rhizobium leguminosarum]TAX43962.1 DUF1348 family protein [Rhizobium leguminosarum]